MGRRTLLLIASVLIAAVGTGLVAVYVRGADARAREGTQQVTIQVASQPIPAGTRVDDISQGQGDYFQARVINAEDAPLRAVGDLKEIAGLVVTVPIVRGAPLQRAMFGENVAEANQTEITKGRVGGSFQLTDPQRVAGLLQPGMRVSVYLVPRTGKATRVIPSVKVVQIGSQTAASSSAVLSSAARSSASADQVPRVILTFDLTDKQQRTLLTDQRDGQLALGLLGDQDTEITP